MSVYAHYLKGCQKPENNRVIHPRRESTKLYIILLFTTNVGASYAFGQIRRLLELLDRQDESIMLL
jgi:hypothetical protein